MLGILNTLNLVDDDSSCCDQTRDREFMEFTRAVLSHLRQHQARERIFHSLVHSLYSP